MNRVKRLKAAIRRLERTTEAEVEAFEHGYATGYNIGRAEMERSLRDLVGEIALAAAFTGKDWAELPAHVAELRGKRYGLFQARPPDPCPDWCPCGVELGDDDLPTHDLKGPPAGKDRFA